MLFAWARRLGLESDDAADFVQDLFVTLVQKMPTFEYDSRHSFRAWLKTIAFNRWRNWVAKKRPVVLGDEHPAIPDSVAEFIEADYLSVVSRRALQIMKSDFEDETWRACWLVVGERMSAQEAATELGIGVAKVYVAKSRVLARLRQELDGLLD